MCLAILAVAILFVVRLFFIQIVQADYYVSQADRQYLRPSVGVFDRGSIFAEKRDGTVFSLAGLKTAYIVALNPKQLVTLGTKPEEIYQKALGPSIANSPEVNAARIKVIENLLKGITLSPQSPTEQFPVAQPLEE